MVETHKFCVPCVPVPVFLPIKWAFCGLLGPIFASLFQDFASLLASFASLFWNFASLSHGFASLPVASSARA